MKNKTTLLIFCALLTLMSYQLSAQCADPANIYTFQYDGTTYELIRENLSWEDACACAVERGGELARIDDQNENDAIFDELMDNAGIYVENTVAPDGGNASYVWLGANDIAAEGTWLWDGNNDGTGDQFWEGAANGNPVNSLYNNWGTEPDNWSNQDAAGIGLTQWPIGSGSLGQPSQWNDVDHMNTLYYLVELNSSSIYEQSGNNFKVKLYPNPVKNTLYVDINNDNFKTYSLTNLTGKEIISNSIKNKELIIDLSDLNQGIYFLKLYSAENFVITKKIVKAN